MSVHGNFEITNQLAVANCSMSLVVCMLFELLIKSEMSYSK